MNDRRNGKWIALAAGLAAGALGAALYAGWRSGYRPRSRRRFDPDRVNYDDIVDAGSAMSFPASDPPAYSAPRPGAPMR